jgi:hypothetical protein
MPPQNLNRLGGGVLVGILVTLLAACGGGGGDTSNSAAPPPPPVNHAPAANAGAAQTVFKTATVTLDGSASSDPDGDQLTYAWTQTSGPTVTLSSATAAKPTFTAPGPAARWSSRWSSTTGKQTPRHRPSQSRSRTERQPHCPAVTRQHFPEPWSHWTVRRALIQTATHFSTHGPRHRESRCHWWSRDLAK